MVDEIPPPFPIPESQASPAKRSRISLVWVIPIIAAVVGAWVAVTQIESEGPKIKIVFDSAEGLEAGKTKIEFKGVDVGTITSLRLSPDHKQVEATAQMSPNTEDFLVEDTQFWVVKPRISGANVTGLGTLISGAYIGMEIGAAKEKKHDFLALQNPPVVTGEVPGRLFVLKAPDLGSLDIGTPVFFRRLQVGEIASYALDRNGQFFVIKVFVRAPYDQYITANSRFWQASGVDMQLSANGLSVKTESVLSILIGGIAFETPTNGGILPKADGNTVFTLFDDRADAFAPPLRNPQPFTLIFNESVRGLVPGAPVELRGIKVGQVVAIRAQVDARTFKFSVPVTIELDAQRLGLRILDLKPGEDFGPVRKKIIDSLVAHGVRAQLRTGNLLTGAAFVAFDFFPGIPAATVDWTQNPPQLPTTPGQLEAVEASVTNIIKKLDKMPLQQIGDNLQKSLADLDLTLVSARGALNNAKATLGNANSIVGPNSAQIQEVDETLQEVRGAARSARVLMDYLERHPEALIRGKRGKPE